MYEASDWYMLDNMYDQVEQVVEQVIDGKLT
jgi:hypothetical protein